MRSTYVNKAARKMVDSMKKAGQDPVHTVFNPDYPNGIQERVMYVIKESVNGPRKITISYLFAPDGTVWSCTSTSIGSAVVKIGRVTEKLDMQTNILNLLKTQLDQTKNNQHIREIL